MEAARPKWSCSLLCPSVRAAPGTAPPLLPSRAAVQYESALVSGGEHHDLLMISNYNADCWCLWGPAMHVLAALTCCSRQISCTDPGWRTATSRMETNTPSQEIIKEQSERFCLCNSIIWGTMTASFQRQRQSVEITNSS